MSYSPRNSGFHVHVALVFFSEYDCNANNIKVERRPILERAFYFKVGRNEHIS